jgi:pimeloyl-ACP methyl ester carboxylesterase
MPAFRVGAVTFHYIDVGSGMPFVFQHGIGGDVRQPVGLFTPPAGVRLLSFDARAHGQTPVGDPAALSFDRFSDDLVALLDHLRLPRAIVGGISMGAAIALNVAVRYPERIAGLVLSRPAWLDSSMPDQVLALFERIVRLLRESDPGDRLAALNRLEVDVAYSELADRFPDTAQSLRGQITEPRAFDAVVRLQRLPRDRPIAHLRDAAAIRVPTLVLAHHQDPVHPFHFGVALARTIRGARLVRLTPKSVDRERHATEIQQALTEFLEPFRQSAVPLGRVA